MKCIRCSSTSEKGMQFDVMKVSHYRERDRFRNRIVLNQRLLGFEKFFICDDCIDKKLEMIRHPWSGFKDKFKTSVFVFIVGTALIIYSWKTKDVALAVGIFCDVFCLVKLWKFIKTTQNKKKNFEKFSVTNARFVAAWEGLSEVVSRKDENNKGVFYIPVTKATYDMHPEDFSKYYRLTAENADKFYKLLAKHNKGKKERSE